MIGIHHTQLARYEVAVLDDLAGQLPIDGTAEPVHADASLLSAPCRSPRNVKLRREYHAAVQRKNAFSLSLYVLSVPLAYISIYAAYFIFALIPAMYFLPEKKLAAASHEQ